MTIRYRAGYKYQLTADAGFQTIVQPPDDIEEAFNGLLIVRAGYAWDGPSGPIVDTPSAMSASLAHDALYQLMREQLLPRNLQEAADRTFRALCIAACMPGWRAWYSYHALRLFGARNTDPSHDRPVLTAP